jgi:hypothetical protein
VSSPSIKELFDPSLGIEPKYKLYQMGLAIEIYLTEVAQCFNEKLMIMQF